MLENQNSVPGQNLYNKYEKIVTIFLAVAIIQHGIIYVILGSPEFTYTQKYIAMTFGWFTFGFSFYLYWNRRNYYKDLYNFATETIHNYMLSIKRELDKLNDEASKNTSENSTISTTPPKPKETQVPPSCGSD